ncbi:hypothetical protein AB0910_14480 [Streptomyces sp. NPDC047002]|uniref:hypothetical protein n=1 Tax=Streptomyces sp. NPDC047002 TaxID=3155475 RepID=UPI003456351D
MGLIPMLCGVLFPPAMLGVVVAMGRFEDAMMRDPKNRPPRPARAARAAAAVGEGPVPPRAPWYRRTLPYAPHRALATAARRTR